MRSLKVAQYQSLSTVIIVQSIPKVTSQYSANFDLLNNLMLENLKNMG